MKRLINIFGLTAVISLAVMIISIPEICLKSALKGILICGNVIIPSIFPFTFCVLFINNSGILNRLRPINRLTTTFFGLNFYEFAVFLISLIGGYPIGAKILSAEKIEKSDIMLNFCINAGPAFIILSIGKGVFNSITIGWILFLSHIISSFFIMVLLRPKLGKCQSAPKSKKPINIIDNFVFSAADACDTLIKICGLVILFSCVNGYIKHLSLIFKPLEFLSLLCEVTNAVFQCDNIITVSFLLGFGGFSIWAQVFALAKNVKINYLFFIFFRILHGTLSSISTLLFLKIFKITVNTISNGTIFKAQSFIKGPTVAFSLIITGIVLIISLYTKKYAGNLREDIV